MKICGRVEVQLHAFLTLALDDGEWPASRPDRFTPGKRAPWYYPLVRRLGRPQSRCGRGGEEKKSPSLPGIERRSSSP